jgi:membrane associated rhomboid family serine protease
MTISRSGRGLFETPHITVYVLLIVTVAISGACFLQSGSSTASNQVLFRYGAMYSSALPRHEYWRLVAYGFLHADLIHIAGNMFCLLFWGAHLEKRVGALYFLIIYFSSMVLGAICGDLLHPNAYTTVGASGATSGILGALLALRLLGKVNLDANFFLINIGLNIAVAVSNSKINWQVHLGGFATGMIAIALIDVVEKINSSVLRCKFPEFAKLNIFALACAAGLLFWDSLPTGMATTQQQMMFAAAYGFAVLLVAKLIDIVLSLKKGLAVVVIALAAANAAVVVLASTAYGSPLSPICRYYRPTIEILSKQVCSDFTLANEIAAAGAFALTLILFAKPLFRGIGDVGFVAASFRGERNRQQGI